MSATGAFSTGSPDRRSAAAASFTAAPRSAMRSRNEHGKRGAPSPGATSAVGGATAPTTVATIATPPAQRRRAGLQDFVFSTNGPAAQLAELTNQVKDEFVKVWVAIQKTEDNMFDVVEQQG